MGLRGDQRGCGHGRFGRGQAILVGFFMLASGGGKGESVIALWRGNRYRVPDKAELASLRSR